MSCCDVPECLHLELKERMSLLLFSRSFDSGWSGEMPIKLAPNSVSGRVVNTFISEKPLYFCVTGNLISNPTDFPIQLACIVFTFSGQLSRLSNAFNNSSE